VYFYEPGHLTRLLGEEGFRPVSITTYDPWHSPGTMEITIRTCIKALLNSSTPGENPEQPDWRPPATASLPTGAHARGARRLATLLPGRAIRVASGWLARASARVGFGNVVDVIARRR
jgi:hypothetical protein